MIKIWAYDSKRELVTKGERGCDSKGGLVTKGETGGLVCAGSVKVLMPLSVFDFLQAVAHGGKCLLEDGHKGITTCICVQQCMELLGLGYLKLECHCLRV
jgi:hypothetical protein